MEEQKNGYGFGRFFLEDNETKRQLRHEGGVTVLSPRDFATLRKLLKSGNDPVSKTDLYFGDNDTGNDVEKSIVHLRKLLFDDFREPKYIRTVDKGYAFIAEINNTPEGPVVPVILPRPNLFNSWLVDSDNRLLKFLVLGCLGVTLAVSFLGGPFAGGDSITNLSLIQAIIVFIAAFYPVKIGDGLGEKTEDEAFWNGLDVDERRSTACASFPEWKTRSRIGENLLGQYRKNWQWVLLSWAFLYACLFLTGLLGLNFPEGGSDPSKELASTALKILSTALNNCTTGAIFLCFALLNSPTKLGKNYQPKTTKLLNIVIVAIVVFTLAECLFIYLRGGFRGQSAMAAQIIYVFNGISGVAAAAVYAQYFGRLQDRFLNPPSWLITLLFIYMAIQSLFFFLDQGTSGVILMDLALFFKSLLFLYTVFLFQTGRLLFYLIRVRKTYETVEEEFDTFRRIPGR